jgi:hypothetical protein
MREKSLHAVTKRWYTCLGDRLEAKVDGYVVDIVRGDLLIEIQTRNFSAIKTKLNRLIRGHKVRLVYPIPQRKWVVHADADGVTMLSRRRSPKRGRIEDLFSELVYIPSLVKNPNFSLEVLLVQSEDLIVDDGLGSWRRRGWSLLDRRLLDVSDRFLFENPEDFGKLLPPTLPKEFTTRDIVERLEIRPAIAQKMIYCLRKMGVVDVVGRRGRALLYSRPGETPAVKIVGATHPSQ